MKAPEVKAPELKAADFDRAFDAGEDVSGHVDWAQARRVNLEARRVNVDFPMGISSPGSSTRSTGRPRWTRIARSAYSPSCNVHGPALSGRAPHTRAARRKGAASLYPCDVATARRQLGTVERR